MLFKKNADDQAKNKLAGIYFDRYTAQRYAFKGGKLRPHVYGLGQNGLLSERELCSSSTAMKHPTVPRSETKSGLSATLL